MNTIFLPTSQWCIRHAACLRRFLTLFLTFIRNVVNNRPHLNNKKVEVIEFMTTAGVGGEGVERVLGRG